MIDPKETHIQILTEFLQMVNIDNFAEIIYNSGNKSNCFQIVCEYIQDNLGHTWRWRFVSSQLSSPVDKPYLISVSVEVKNWDKDTISDGIRDSVESKIENLKSLLLMDIDERITELEKVKKEYKTLEM